ncbi:MULTISPECIES: undecaprenyldiphospho-muramoylpentapeptide beta-N-acetylglucosaminyltransferase [unclassified Roseitalea]|uniref:undecaprenyldiphospho-muramoylpentapeptide beta-N-acetylglucosaminyltransferase n=1 Tax=unclassified Roseitalea TaxID=2639107 RepID=UPI00273D716E|nr:MULTISPECIES: undecaprenyldiphospho-muramoylpentapeptide beta-N-acetylglucosaminyltransferase [unclassified Roseitalea]
MAESGTILLSAGGTGGHLFPAQALAHELVGRGWQVHLATDERARHYAEDFPGEGLHVIRSATPSGKNPFALIRAGLALFAGMRQSRILLSKLKPAAVVGFGGYPTVPPLIAASGAFPTIIHEQNAVMGRANRLLARRATAIAGGFLAATGEHAGKIVVTGNPVRPPVIEAAGTPYAPPDKDGPVRLVVFGGSQGARFFSEAMPAAMELLSDDLRARVEITQQARPEDETAAKSVYEMLRVSAELAPFFDDLPDRVARAHLVLARSGASTVSEIAVIGRPAILVPYPHALDHDQAANAAALEAAGGALVRRQSELMPEAIAGEIARLVADPDALATMAANARQAGRPDAAALLADLTEAIARGQSPADFRARQA